MRILLVEDERDMASWLMRALAQVKRASAVVNHALGLQDAKKTEAIVAAAYAAKRLPAVRLEERSSRNDAKIAATKVTRQVGIGIRQRLVLADRAAQLGGERVKAIRSRPSEAGPRQHERSQQSLHDSLSDFRRGNSSRSTRSLVRGPACRKRTRPSRSITKVSGRP